MAICHSKFHRTHGFYEIRGEMTRKLRNCQTYETDNCLKANTKYFKENFDPP
ncbi:uncharacterized protein G2W53_041204 [Senna tora]|uniref:Uncharacterized protein n=1 Tax=Senna tora TaxID=362788 RepID=A0A834SH17_9FABA|nr:uncharacterized protein G2W53_041204 [Senna tora]